MELYKNKSPRLQNWDYGSDGYYFITISTQNKTNYFGEIVLVRSDHDPTMMDLEELQIWSDHDPTLRETPIGKTATDYWNEIPNHFPFVELDAFILMPDHLHGILKFNKGINKTWDTNRYTSPSQNLGSIVRQYKGSVKRYANKNNIDFSWHNGYFDKIVHTIDELHNIRNYIQNNPQKWIEKYGSK